MLCWCVWPLHDHSVICVAEEREKKLYLELYFFRKRWLAKVAHKSGRLTQLRRRWSNWPESEASEESEESEEVRRVSWQKE